MMVYYKQIPSIPNGVWGWSYWEGETLWFIHATHTSSEDAQNDMESFMVKRWTE